MQSLVAMLFKDPHLPIFKTELISVNHTHSIVPSTVPSSQTDPVSTIDLGHNAITLLLIPLVYVPYFACHLTVLSIQGNQLKSIPTALWQLTSLVELDLNHNQITYLSPFLVCLQNLRCLDVSHNQLIKLPPQFPYSLQVLDLSNNFLSSAPSVLLDLPSIFRLWIDENRFLNAVTGAQSNPSPVQGVLSLRDLAVQAMARHLKLHGIHTYCHHALDFSVHAHMMDYPILQQITCKQTSDTTRQYPFLVKDDLKYLNEQVDLDPYTHHQSNHSSIAANISHVPANDVDVKFAELVHAKIVTHVRKRLNEEHALIQTHSEYTNDSFMPNLQDYHLHGQNTRKHGLTIDVSSQTQETAGSNACPLSPLIMDWASKLPLPSLKSMNAESLSPFTPSLPSPPSAFSTFCIFQIVPVPLLVSLIVPIGLCGICGEGIYRTQECGMIHLTAIQMCKGNLIPLHWTLCSVACWRTAKDKTARPIRIN